MTYLPDVNLWIAWTLEDHTHHQAALKWIEATHDTIAFCRVTQMGFLRLLTNFQVMSDAVLSAQEAWRLLERIRGDDRMVFVSEPPGLEDLWRRRTISHKTSVNFWTDAYLSAFVEVAGYTLVTFDRGFEKRKDLAVRVLKQ